MATNLNKNTIIRSISNTRDTEPASSTLTGTVTITASSLVVTGSGTAFTTELGEGAWLYFPADNEIRQVTKVVSATECRISDAFTNAYAGATFRRIPNKDCNRKEIGFLLVSGITGLIDGVQIPTNAYGRWDVSSREREVKGKDFCDPVIFDSQTVVGNFIITAKKA